MGDGFTAEQVRAAQVMVGLAKSEGREPDRWTVSVAAAHPVPAADVQTIKVTADQVDNARLLVAIDRASGREPDEWILRLASARTS